MTEKLNKIDKAAKRTFATALFIWSGISPDMILKPNAEEAALNQDPPIAEILASRPTNEVLKAQVLRQIVEPAIQGLFDVDLVRYGAPSCNPLDPENLPVDANLRSESTGIGCERDDRIDRITGNIFGDGEINIQSIGLTIYPTESNPFQTTVGLTPTGPAPLLDEIVSIANLSQSLEHALEEGWNFNLVINTDRTLPLEAERNINSFYDSSDDIGLGSHYQPGINKILTSRDSTFETNTALAIASTNNDVRFDYQNVETATGLEAYNNLDEKIPANQESNFIQVTTVARITLPKTPTPTTAPEGTEGRVLEVSYAHDINGMRAVTPNPLFAIPAEGESRRAFISDLRLALSVLFNSRVEGRRS